MFILENVILIDSQLCDKSFFKSFLNDKITFMNHGNKNTYTIDIKKHTIMITVLSSIMKVGQYRRLGYVNTNFIPQLKNYELVKYLFIIIFKNDWFVMNVKWGNK